MHWSSIFVVAFGLLLALAPSVPSTVPATLPTSAAPRASGAPGEVRVATFNVRYDNPRDRADAWPLRRAGLLSVLRDLDSDLIGLQELLAHQHDEVVSALADYHAVGVGRDDGRRAGEFATVLVRRDRFDVVASGTIWLSPTPEVAGSKGWDAALPRICTWVRVRAKFSGPASAAPIELIFANAHFDHAGPRARAESARLLVSRLRTLAGQPGVPVVFVGDFNFTEVDAPYGTLAEAYTDVYRAAHPARRPDEATYHGFRGTAAGSRIDFIFLSRDDRGVTPTGAEIRRAPLATGRWPSDHFPVTATLAIK